MGFGSGLNFLTTWQLWDRTKPKGGRLHFISFEKHPFSKDELTQALSAWPELTVYSQRLVQHWPGRVKGFHRLHFGDVTLTLIHDDITYGLKELNARIDAWFLDGFSPAKNPDMWSDTVMTQIARLSAPKARLATFTVARAVRAALENAGFQVERKTGFGRKRHRLEAYYKNFTPTQSAKPERIAIIGAGIAGHCLAHAFERRGIQADIFADDSLAASGNPAALIKPRLDIQDRPESRFFLSAYLYALQFYQGADNTILTQGVTHQSGNMTQQARFEKLAQNAPLPSEHLRFDDVKTTLELDSAIVINPAALLQTHAVQTRKIIDMTSHDDGHNLTFFDGSNSQEYSHVLIAAGYGIKALLPELNMRFSRGQISWAEKGARLTRSLTYGGYAVPLEDGLLLGATHDRLQDGVDPYQLSGEDDRKNFAQFEEAVGFALSPHPEHISRASVRVTTANTLPAMAQIRKGVWVLSGLGSRGFVFAPLLAESLTSELMGEAIPLAKSAKALFEKNAL